MNCRIRNLLLLLAIAAVSAGKSSELNQLSVQQQRSLEGTPTQSPIIPPKEEHKPKPAPKPAADHPPPAPKTNVKKPPAPKPAPKPAPAPPAPAPSSSTGSSGSSSSASSGGKHSVGHHSGPSANIKDKSSSSHGGAKKPLLLLIGAAASTLIIAGYTKSKRRSALVKDHPLKGSLGRRMKTFGDLAGGKNRRGSLDNDEDMGYKSADDYGITIV